jgi:predicted DNA-binding protein (UPF0251 family)
METAELKIAVEKGGDFTFVDSTNKNGGVLLTLSLKKSLHETKINKALDKIMKALVEGKVVGILVKETEESRVIRINEN